MRFILIILVFVYSNVHSQQIWKSIRTSLGAFTREMDGRKVASLRSGDTLIACGGWTPDSTTNQVYYSVDKGVHWVQKPLAPWPGENDFLFYNSYTGDTLVKWGGDNSTHDTKRIDIYVNGTWSNVGTWSATINSGIGLTGCRAVDKYFMLGGDNGKLSYFKLSALTPTVVHQYTGDTAIVRGFMCSLPNGWLIWGAGFYGVSTANVSGKIYYSADGGATASLLMQDNIFKTYWANAVTTASGVIYFPGRDDSGNHGGVYWISYTDLYAGNDNWQVFDYWPNPRHAMGACTKIDASNNLTNDVIGVQGNFYNDSWLFKRINQ